MEIYISSGFNRKYKKLPKGVKTKAEAKEKIFEKNAFDSRLDTHKLHGKDKDLWSYSISKSYRIKFVFLKKGKVLYLTVGTHDEVY